jgi:hypothetical protein
MLIIEADFEHDPPRVALRFYLVNGDKRRVQYMQDLYNLARRKRSETDTDATILNDVYRWISKPTVIKGNLQLLKLRREEYDVVSKRWTGLGDRLIDRKSQAPIGPDSVID